MAYFMGTKNSALPVMFNLSKDVGRGCPNQADDVALATFMVTRWIDDIIRMRNDARLLSIPANMVSAVRVGVYDSAFQALIDEIQDRFSRNVRPDGRISRADSDLNFDADGHGNAYLIAKANARVARVNANIWPRLDLAPGCPAIVAALVRGSFGL